MNPLFPNTEGNLEEWLDHSEAKENIKRWLISESRFSAFTVDSAQQLIDLSKWIKNNTKDTFIGEATFQSDLHVLKWNLIYHLVLSLKNEIEFKDFYNKLGYIDNLDLRNTYKQEIIYETKLGATKSGDVRQIMNINSPLEYLPTEYRRDAHIERLHEAFLNDLDSAKKSNILLLIKFCLQGLNSLNSEFRGWFIETFCRRTILYSNVKTNVKICVLNEGDLEEIYIDNIYQAKFGYLPKEILLKETEKYIMDKNLRKAFCSGLGAHKEIPYHLFKLALIDCKNSLNSEN